jgi:hypothetical protein
VLSALPPGAETPAEDPRPSRRPLVLGGVAGFVIGSTLIGILWAVSGPGAGANADAVAACAALARASDLPLTMAGDGRVVGTTLLDAGLMKRISAARDLAASAAAVDSDYEELAEHMDGVNRMVISLHFTDPAGHRHYELAKQMCARL